MQLDRLFNLLLEAIKSEKGLYADERGWARNARQNLPGEERRIKHKAMRGVKAKFSPHSAPVSSITNEPSYKRHKPKTLDQKISARKTNSIKTDPDLQSKKWDLYTKKADKAAKGKEAYWKQHGIHNNAEAISHYNDLIQSSKYKRTINIKKKDN